MSVYDTAGHFTEVGITERDNHANPSVVTNTVGDGHTERLIRRLPDSLGAHSSDVWGVQCVQLCKQYAELHSESQFQDWQRCFSVWLYSLLLQDGDCLEGWRNEAILRSYPVAPEARCLAWRIIETYGVTSGDRKTFSDRSIGSLVLLQLLSTGSIDAFRFLKKRLMTDLLPPTHQVHLGFRLFLRALSGGDNYHRLVTDIRYDIGNRWEVLSRKAAEVLYGRILIEPLLVNGRRPDIVPDSQETVWESGRLVHAPKAIECKKTVWSSYIPLVLKSYSACFDYLEMWVLENHCDTPDFFWHERHRLGLVYGGELAERVRHLDPSLAEEISVLSKEDNEENLDARLLRAVSGNRHSEGLITGILELSDYLRPYFAKPKVPSTYHQIVYGSGSSVEKKT